MGAPSIARTIIRKVVAQPIILAQAWLVLTQLALLATLSRLLPRVEYGEYVAAITVTALINGVLGVSLATRIAASAASDTVRLRLRDLSQVLLSGLIGGLAATVLRLPTGVCVMTGLATAGTVCAEIALGGFLLRRQISLVAKYLALRATLGGLTPATLVFLSPGLRSAPVALSGGISSGLVAIIVLLLPGRLPVSLRGGTSLAGIRGVGGIQVAQWTIASADKVVMAHLGLFSTLAQYSLIYGLHDRAYRTLAQTISTEGLARGGHVGRRRRSIDIFILASIPVAGTLAPLAAWILSGGRYSPSIGLSLVIACALGLMTLGTRHYVGSVLGGGIRGLNATSVVVALMYVLACVVGIRAYGALGAALATLGAYGVLTLLFMYFHRAAR